MTGTTSYHSGLAAEQIVCRFYEGLGARRLTARWRGKSGEIDLVLEDEDGLIFVEVKKATTHEAAAQRVSLRQIGRIARAAEEYAARLGRNGASMRLDAALVDRHGRVQLLPNISIV